MSLAIVVAGCWSGGAIAMPLPEAFTVEAKVGLLWHNRETVKQAGGRPKLRSFTSDETATFRLFRVGKQLVVSMPDFGSGAVFTEGKERVKNAFRVGDGQYACKKLDQEAGAVGQTCFMYQTQGDTLVLSQRYIGDVYESTGEYEKVFRIRVAAGDCTASLASGRSQLSHDGGGMIALPGMQGSETVATAQFNGSSCRLLKGRKAF
ncbi:hypothetical protein [Ancylobacter rudongensis]|uniref:Uncharacterized protein n=1 Tax=Ancylobacter rudongensis TaxID=177413 RepID=A0A1G4SBZ9_9HYPH|nr:hypothetical protein [Ancylobacter rudongensis]SCW66558.1 hypothetical protein SAMN05660859_2087 [Ancylobacter rudongensis]